MPKAFSLYFTTVERHFCFMAVEGTIILGELASMVPRNNFAKLRSNIRNFRDFWNHF